MRSELLAVVPLVVALGANPTAQVQEHDRVWVWNSRCPTPTHVALRVRLDGTTVYATSLPLCQWERRFEEGKASFRFTPARPLVWYGYRSYQADRTKDAGDTTPAGTTLDVDFWQAGGESDVIELGYSVAGGDQLHMNSIYRLSPTQKGTTTMAPGLVLETWPERKRET